MSFGKSESRRLALSGLAAVILTGSLGGCASVGAGSESSALQGEWRMAGNRFASDISLKIADSSISGSVGCIGWGSSYSASNGLWRFQKEGEIAGIEMEAPCLKEEMSSGAAWAYWHHLLKIIWATDTYRIAHGQLTMSTASGEHVSFRQIHRTASAR